MTRERNQVGADKRGNPGKRERPKSGRSSQESPALGGTGRRVLEKQKAKQNKEKMINNIRPDLFFKQPFTRIPVIHSV
uniref:Uncharacterized protein n=1 Tax=Bursaphelenchus xylophilus TaxID=6326 RepID=A0A1I7S8V6_BURXY